MGAEAKPLRRDHADLSKTFDWMADRYVTQTTMISWGQYPGWIRHMVRLIQDHSPDSLVDIGCGPGVLLREVSRALPGCRLNAVDPSREMLKRVPGEATKFHSTLQEWAPSHRGQYGAAVMSFVLRDLPNPSDAIRQASTVLHPGGQLLVLETHTPEGWREWGFRLYFHHWLPWQGDRVLARDWPGDRYDAPYRWLSDTHRTWYRGEDLPRWMSGAGLKSLRCHTKPDDVVMLWSAVKG